ncbi:MAG TPA: DUF3300 domain-containing protein [Acidobacteriaceae bacterium]|nr:DUF3300 domain-containing protein [Acidobacteriaceae bacterium]
MRTQAFIIAGLLLLGTFPGVLAYGQYTPPPPPPPPDQTAPANMPPGPPAQPQGPPPMVAPQQLDPLVSRIALYPDPLLAQVLTASTFWPEIPDATNWSSQHAGLSGDALANAIQQDNLPWDPSVLALLPFPQVLQMMAQDPGWTQALGNAVLAQRPDVMDAVQRMRQQAYNYGYLRPSPYDSVVNTGGYIEIMPVNPAYLYVPVYSPAVVFAPPRPGVVVGLSIHFAPSVFVGPAFVPFGWARPGFGWGAHTIIIGGSPWNRTWANRAAYVHPYPNAYRPAPGPRMEDHHVYHDTHEHPR